ncbi:MAG TPA: serine/threonine-protein kinase, partial [Longimicrobiaceae bacterium]
MRSLSSERWQQIDEIFAAALERAPAERDAFLRERCGGDAALRAEVESLLRSYGEAEEVLGESVSDFAEPLVEDLRATLEREEMEALPGDGRIGPYRLLRVIGRGGMGAVYLAERADDQFEKRVALKLVKRGMDTDEVLQRFRYERQILAALEHPNIGRLYDGGAAEDGRPYLVMEHIAGEPVTTYCDRRRLSIDERLKIFETICGAVQFAHRNLVVHRDIKPSNILVTAEGTVKLLDFGIAKLLDPAHPELVPQTRTEMRLLTPEYASPEQIDGAQVTTASDVFALGVILFELLTGRRPSDGRGRRTQDRFGLDTGLGRPSSTVVRSLPSEKPGEAPESAEEIAARRSTTPERLRMRLRGDLDTITLKALAEEPERRYHTAEQLLADVQRYRRGLPVLARGESFGYRATKFVRRHRVVVSFSSALAVLLIGFVTT